MAADDTIPPLVLKGTVIRTSRGMLLGLSAGSAFLAFVSGFLLWDTWSHGPDEHVLPFQLGKHSLHTSFGAVLGVLGGTGCMLAFGWDLLFPRHLVLGEEALQVIWPGWFDPTVQMQIPYSNIASVTCQREEHGFQQLRVRIHLQRPTAPGMYLRRRDYGAGKDSVRDLELPGSFTLGPQEIARLIEERREKASGERTQ